MTRKEFNAAMADYYGRTRAEWQMYIFGREWDGSLYHKGQLFDAATIGVTYTIVPYYGGLYPDKIDAFGKPLNIQIK